jgi:hypothetical protein
MVKLARAPFYDKALGDIVYYWQDCYFEQYMATSPWSYRIKLYKS